MKLQLDLTESAQTVDVDPGFVVLLMFTYCVAVVSGETNDAHLDEFLVNWIHSHRRASEGDPTIQHPLRKFNLFFAGAICRYRSPVEKHTEVSPRERIYSESSYSTRHIFSLVRCITRGIYTSSVYPTHPIRHPSRHPRHRKRK